MSSGADLAAGGAGAHSSTMSSGSSILSDKVSRALEVRTDTPAMMAALDALSNLPPSEGASSGDAAGGSGSGAGGGGGGGGGVIDARSVRVAIERDALRQALLFEEELRSLVSTVSELRSSVSAVSSAAAKVARSVEAGVVVAHGSHKSKASGEEKEGGEGDADEMPLFSGSASSSSLEEERRLAALLSDAFRARNEAARRAETVSAFLDRFDLSDSDAHLLDHYAFEEFDPSAQQQQQQNDGGMNLDPDSGETKPKGDGMAFLDALERVRAIRTELVKTFGDDGTLGGSLGSSSGGHRKSKSGKKAEEKLGAASAVRMMESLASRQERAYSRLYHFLQAYLDLNSVSHVPTSSAAMSGRHGSRMQSHASSAAQHHARGRGRFGDDDEADEALFAHPFVKHSLSVLRHVPAYRFHMLELISGSRRGEVTRRFLLALTSGYNGAPPIEMRAHDPVGYVGDMLAFAFRAFSVEAELSRGLVDYDPREESEESEHGQGNEKKREDEEEEDEGDEEDDDILGEDDPISSVDRPMTSTSVLSTSVSGLARPLRSRIAQVVSSLARRPDEDDEADHHHLSGTGHGSHHSTVSGEADLDEESASALHRLAGLYSICGLLLFYRSAFEKGVRKLEANAAGARKKKKGGAGSWGRGGGGAAEKKKEEEDENPLVQCARQCLTEAAAAYAAALRVYAASLDGLASDPSAGGGAPASASPSDLARVAVTKICDVRSSSPGFAVDVGMTLTVHGGHEGRAKEESDALRAALSSLELDFLCGALLGPALVQGRGCRTLDDAVSLKVALATAKRAGLDAESYSKWDVAISDREKELADDLIRTETRTVLYACGLGPVVDSLRKMETFVEGQTVSSHPGLGPREVEASVKEFYASLYSPPLPSFEGIIKDPVLRKYARGRTAEGVADAYGEVYKAVTSENGGYDDLSFLGHDPGQVRTLLSL